MKPLKLKYLYGGEIRTLGYIIKDLQRIAPNQQCVDRFLRTQKPI